MMNYKKNNRTKLLIDSKFQKHFLAITMLGFGAIVVINLCVYLYFFRTMKGLGVANGLAQEDVFFLFIEKQQNLYLGIFLIASILVFIVIFYLGLHLSNRVAGPLYRIRNYIEAGDTSRPLKTRSGDYFQELVKAINDKNGHSKE